MQAGKRNVILGSVGAVAVVLLLLSIAGLAGSKSEAPGAAGTLVRGTVVVDFTGAPSQRPPSSAAFSVEAGQSAWTAVQQAVGAGNLTFQDFGPELGIFITGLHGVAAEGNHFWSFQVNGRSSDVGVSAYIVRDGDRLEFKYETF